MGGLRPALQSMKYGRKLKPKLERLNQIRLNGTAQERSLLRRGKRLDRFNYTCVATRTCIPSLRLIKDAFIAVLFLEYFLTSSLARWVRSYTALQRHADSYQLRK